MFAAKAQSPGARRIFLLSPASCSGKRAQILLRPEAQFELASRVHGAGAPLGEVFAFLSGLYFRGKAAYADCFARPPRGTLGAHVITATRGLLPIAATVTRQDLLGFDSIDIDPSEPRYAAPLRASAERLAESLPSRTDVVLLGSVASDKYTRILLPVFAERLLFPSAFVGRGDMSRGGLMLRSVRSGVELDYITVAGAVVHGQRPRKLGARR